MNQHRRAEAKAARRRKRIAESRGGGRGPITRAMERAALMNVGERNLLGMVATTRPLTVAQAKARKVGRPARKPAPALRLVPTSYGTFTRPEIAERLEDRHYADIAA